jgi:flagellin
MASFSVVTNVASANALANLNVSQTGLNRALQRLSSGLRINMSADDAAGLAVANQYQSQIAGYVQGIRNANDGLSSLQIKDGAMGNLQQLINRLSTLATQAASGHTSDQSRLTLDQEFQAVINEIQRQASVAGLTSTSGFSVFVSAAGAEGTVSGTISAVTTTTLSLANLSLAGQAAAQTAINALTSAVTSLGRVQGTIGALENRLQFAIGLSQTQQTNTQSAESRIRDANVAEEAANLTRLNILNQAGIAALAQANQSTSAVLSLLRG